MASLKKRLMKQTLNTINNINLPAELEYKTLTQFSHNRKHMLQMIIRQNKGKLLKDISNDINKLIDSLLETYSEDFISYLYEKEPTDHEILCKQIQTLRQYVLGLIDTESIESEQKFDESIRDDNSKNLVLKQMKLFIIIEMVEELKKNYNLDVLIDKFNEYRTKLKSAHTYDDSQFSELKFSTFEEYEKHIMFGKQMIMTNRLIKLQNIIHENRDKSLKDISNYNNKLIVGLLEVYNINFISNLKLNKDNDMLCRKLEILRNYMLGLIDTVSIESEQIFDNIHDANSQNLVLIQIKIVIINEILEELNENFQLIHLIEKFKKMLQEEFKNEMISFSSSRNEHANTTYLKKDKFGYEMTIRLDEIYKLNAKLRLLINSFELIPKSEISAIESAKSHIIELKEDIIKLEKKILRDIKKAESPDNEADNANNNANDYSELTLLIKQLNAAINPAIKEMYQLFELKCKKIINEAQFDYLIKSFYGLLYLRIQVKEKKDAREDEKEDAKIKEKLDKFFIYVRHEINKFGKLCESYGIIDKLNKYSEIYSIETQLKFMSLQIDFEKIPEMQELNNLKSKFEFLYYFDDENILNAILSIRDVDQKKLYNNTLGFYEKKHKAMLELFKQIKTIEPSSIPCKKPNKSTNNIINTISTQINSREIKEFYEKNYNYIKSRNNYALSILIKDKLGMDEAKLLEKQIFTPSSNNLKNNKANNNGNKRQAINNKSYIRSPKIIKFDIDSRLDILEILKKIKKTRESDNKSELILLNFDLLADLQNHFINYYTAKIIDQIENLYPLFNLDSIDIATDNEASKIVDPFLKSLNTEEIKAKNSQESTARLMYLRLRSIEKTNASNIASSANASNIASSANASNRASSANASNRASGAKASNIASGAKASNIASSANASNRASSANALRSRKNETEYIVSEGILRKASNTAAPNTAASNTSAPNTTASNTTASKKAAFSKATLKSNSTRSMGSNAKRFESGSNARLAHGALLE